MDAKRIIPMLQVRAGRVTEPVDGPPVDWARRLELAGADEILFLDDAAPERTWIQDAAAALFIPFAVTCPWGAPLEAVLAAGADQGLLEVGPADLDLLARASQVLGRGRLRVAVELGWTLERGWRARMPLGAEDADALAWLAELGQMGAGELLLSIQDASGADLGALFQDAARLPMPVIFIADGREQAREALLNGADGIAYPISQGSPADYKAFLADLGLALR